MRTETRLLISATPLGATVGAFAALRLSKEVSPRTIMNEPATHAPGGDHRTMLPESLGPVPTRAAPSFSNQAISVPLDEIPTALGGVALDGNTDPSPAPSAVASSAKAASPFGPNEVAQRAIEIVAWQPTEERSKSEQQCTVGDPLECLRLASLLDGGAHGPVEERSARYYKERAYSILVLRCHQRSPDACLTIARMHVLGFGLPKSPESVTALVARSRQLCKLKATAVCSAFGP